LDARERNQLRRLLKEGFEQVLQRSIETTLRLRFHSRPPELDSRTHRGEAAYEVHLIHQNIFHNDRIVPIGRARLSPGQAGLMNGWRLFTTMRIFHGEAFAYERHWQRLEKDAARIRLPFAFDPAQVSRQYLPVKDNKSAVDLT
jgi:hypothetical protein